MVKTPIKNILTIAPYLVLLLVCVWGYFFYQGQQETAYKLYKEKIELALKENVDLEKTIDSLKESIILSQKEKKKLLDDLAKKKVVIVEKEKIVYRDNELVVPEDYDGLKKNYIVISDLYVTKSQMYDTLFAQSEADYDTIESLTKALEKVQAKNMELAFIIEHPEKPPIKFIQQAFYGGIGITANNTPTFSFGYGLTIKERVEGIVKLDYPFAVSILIGIRL